MGYYNEKKLFLMISLSSLVVIHCDDTNDVNRTDISSPNTKYFQSSNNYEIFNKTSFVEKLRAENLPEIFTHPEVEEIFEADDSVPVMFIKFREYPMKKNSSFRFILENYLNILEMKVCDTDLVDCNLDNI